VVDDAGFTIDAGETYGLPGPNGADELIDAGKNGVSARRCR